MKFTDRLDIAVARGLVQQHDNCICFPDAFATSTVLPSCRAITAASFARAMRRAGYRRVKKAQNTWRLAACCEKNARCRLQ